MTIRCDVVPFSPALDSLVADDSRLAFPDFDDGFDVAVVEDVVSDLVVIVCAAVAATRAEH